MKKLLTKLFVGDYNVKLNGKYINFVRASTLIVPSMLLMGVAGISGNQPLYITGIVLSAITLVLGFLGNKIVKFKIEDYTPAQKYQFVKMSEQIQLSPELQKKALVLANSKEVLEFEELLKSKKNYNLVALLWNPVAIAIAVILMLV